LDVQGLSHRSISSRKIEKTKSRIANVRQDDIHGVDRQNLPRNHKADAVIGATISGRENPVKSIDLCDHAHHDLSPSLRLVD